MPDPDPTLACLALAEEGLFAVAALLLRVPLSPRTLHLHVRALTLKRELKEARAHRQHDPGVLLREVRALREAVLRESASLVETVAARAS